MHLHPVYPSRRGCLLGSTARELRIDMLEDEAEYGSEPQNRDAEQNSTASGHSDVRTPSTERRGHGFYLAHCRHHCPSAWVQRASRCHPVLVAYPPARSTRRVCRAVPTRDGTPDVLTRLSRGHHGYLRRTRRVRACIIPQIRPHDEGRVVAVSASRPGTWQHLALRVAQSV